MTYSQQSLFTDFSKRIPPDWAFEEDNLNELSNATFHSECLGKNKLEGQSFNVTIRFLSSEDLGALLTLHHKILSYLPKKEIFRADQESFIQAHLNRRGRTIGAFIKDQLIGYAVVSFPKNDQDNLGEFAKLSLEDKIKVAHFDGAGVDPDYRGSQLHRTLNTIRGRFANLAGYDHMMGTVSPLNPYSLMNHLAAGFHIVNFTKRYGGMDRLIIYRKGLTHKMQAFDQQHLIDLKDRHAIKEGLDQGFVGTELVKTGTGYFLCLGK